MILLPGLVFEIGLHRCGKIVVRLLQVEDGDIIVCILAAHHPSSHLALAQLFLFALDRAWRQADASPVPLPRNQDGLAREEQVVAGQFVRLPQHLCRNTVSQRQRGYRIMLVVQKVQYVVRRRLLLGRQRGLLVVYGLRVSKRY